MTVEIVHPVSVETIEPMYAAAMRAYLEPLTATMADWRRRHVDVDRAWTAVEDGRIVGTLRTIEDTVSVPGRSSGPTVAVDADLLSLVSVAATHRRRGLLTRMIGESLTLARDEGKPVSILVAAEWPIYGRYGYAPAVFHQTLRIDRRAAGAVVVAPPTGSVHEIDVEAAADLAPPLHDAEARRRGGVIGRDAGWWERTLRRRGDPAAAGPTKPDTRHVVHRDPAGAVDGYARWEVSEQVDSEGWRTVIEVEDLFGATPVAARELWRFFCSIDLVTRVDAVRRPVDDDLPFLLTDGRAAEPHGVRDAMWLKLLDVPAALGARGYDVEDELTLEVVDPSTAGPSAAGRYTLTTGPDGARCDGAAGRSPDLTLPASTLAAVYLGGVRAARLVATGALDEHTPGAVGRLDRLFATALAPWRVTDF